MGCFWLGIMGACGRLTTLVFAESHVLRNAKYFAWYCLIELKIILSFVVVRHASYACWRPGNCQGWSMWTSGMKQCAGGRGAWDVKCPLAMWEGMLEVWDGAGTCAKNPSCWRLAQCLCPEESTLLLALLFLIIFPNGDKKMNLMALAGVLHGNLSSPKGIKSLGMWLL